MTLRTRSILVLIVVAVLSVAPSATAGCDYTCYQSYDTAHCYQVFGTGGNMVTCEEVYRCFGDPLNPTMCYADCEGSHCLWT